MMKKILSYIFITLITVILIFFIVLGLNHQTPILMYHSLDKTRVETYAAVDLEIFKRQLDFIRKNQYQPITLSRYCQMLKNNKPISSKHIVITFDDGYQDNLEGIKLLNKQNMPATIFIIGKNIGQDGYLSKKQIKYFLKNSKVEIGSHTLTHRYLPDLTNPEIKTEVFQSKKYFEDLFNTKVETISYPIGGFDKRVLKTVKDSDYLCACTTNRGFSKKQDRFALRRIKISNDDLGIKLWAKISGFYNFFKRVKEPH